MGRGTELKRYASGLLCIGSKYWTKDNDGDDTKPYDDPHGAIPWENDADHFLLFLVWPEMITSLKYCVMNVSINKNPDNIY